ncbi:MAG TPA: deoxynucleoside kinase [Chloroflexia bacterium]|nr:deoxynucleoside kinase [Chloroflexia bacterium]
MKKYFVAVAGNIGVGKSSLTTLLAQRMGWEPFFEAVAENPYLADFYADMPTWSFHSQIFFLSRRLYDYRAMMEHPTSVLQDRTVYEDAEIFARNLYRQGLMSERDWASYWDLYSAVSALLPPPDLVVYLQASVSTLTQRIGMRGREFEQQIGEEYLARLNDLYDEWVAGFNLCPVLTIATDNLDFVHAPEHLDIIAARIEDRLRGKEVLTFERRDNGEEGG